MSLLYLLQKPGKPSTSFLFLLVLSMSGLFFSCGEKDLVCGADKDLGIIEESRNAAFYCMPAGPELSLIIRTEAELDSLYLETCPDDELPVWDIDLEQYTLLAVYAEGTGCDVSFIREVQKDQEDRKYVYTVKVKECGQCKMLVYSMNWVLVPKLPVGWSVEFSVSHP